MNFVVHHGDCLAVMRTMPDSSVDSIVTDPPYGLSFMGKRWDYDVPGVEVWAECLRVLKPGGHLLAFAGTRTQHRMAVRIEDAGFEIRDMIAWVYGSGFPKSLDVSKAIDKVNGEAGRLHKFTAWMRTTGLTGKQINDATGTFMGSHYLTDKSQPAIPTPELWTKLRPLCGDVPVWVDELVERIAAEREVVGRSENGIAGGTGKHAGQDAAYGFAGAYDITAPATDAARQWQGWGTALKPALETVTFASKPYADEQGRDIILSNLIRLEARLWLLSSASAAEKNSTSNPSEYGAACGIAQWSAEETTSTRAALCDQMGMSLFELATTTSLNIVSSWRHTLAESWSDGNTSTTETKSSTTTDWKTLKFSLSQITAESIIKACSLPGGFSANATTAESHFNASLSLLQSIRTLSATERAMSQAQHEHQGAGVKPNLDPCIMARKPLAKGHAVAANVLEHGTGALNIDGCRITTEEDLNGGAYAKNGGRSESQSLHGGSGMNVAGKTAGTDFVQPAGRWPANLIHDGSEEVVASFPQAKGQQGAVTGDEPSSKTNAVYGQFSCRPATQPRGDAGSAARFFYCAKASRKDRNEGCEHMAAKPLHWSSGSQNPGSFQSEGTDKSSQNNHPTVKPTDLMRYLCRLVTPPGGLVVDPFCGSGSTGKAAVIEGFRFIGIDREAEYVEIARARIDFAVKGNDIPQGDLFEVNP